MLCVCIVCCFGQSKAHLFYSNVVNVELLVARNV